MYQVNLGTPSNDYKVTAYAPDREPEQPVVELTQEQKDSASQERYRSLSEALKQQRAFDPDGLRIASLEKELSKMEAEGFVYKPKAVVVTHKVVHPVPVTRLEPTSWREEFNIKELVECTICGERVTPGLARHRTDEGLDCILDPERCHKSGMAAERIADALERQARAKESEL